LRSHRTQLHVVIVCAVAVLCLPARLRAQLTPETTGADGVDEAAGQSGSVTEAEGESESVSESEAEAVSVPEAEAERVSEAEAEAGTESDDEGLSFNVPGLGRTAFSMTSTTTARYRGENYDFNSHDDNFASLQQRLDMSLQSDEVRLELRLDGFLPFVPGITHGESSCIEGEEALCYLRGNARPERFTLEWQHSDWKVQLGDAYSIMGRGIALAFRKVDLLGVDTALRGGQVHYEGRHFHAQILGGVANPQNLDPTNLRVIDEQLDRVIGTDLGARLGANDDVDFALQYSRVWFRDDENGYQNRVVDVVGWRAELPALADGALSLYVEANGLRRSYVDFGMDGNEFGRAVYGSVQLQMDKFTVLAEWQDYRNFMVAATTNETRTYRIYSAQPTLELEGLQRVRGIGNRRGGSLKIDYAFNESPWSVGLNSLLVGFNEDPNADPWDGILVSHTWVTLRRFNDASSGASADETSGDDAPDDTSGADENASRFGWTLDALAGFRRETYLHDPSSDLLASGDVDRQVMHADIDSSFGAGMHSFEARVEQRYEREFVFDHYNDFTQGSATVTWSYGQHLSVSPAVRWNSESKGVIAQRDMRAYNFLGGTFFPALEVKWTFTPGNFISLFGGMTPGGQICSGGVCRVVPPFEGVLSQLVLRL
jgi:hypothetical protein